MNYVVVVSDVLVHDVDVDSAKRDEGDVSRGNVHGVLRNPHVDIGTATRYDGGERHDAIRDVCEQSKWTTCPLEKPLYGDEHGGCTSQ